MLRREFGSGGRSYWSRTRSGGKRKFSCQQECSVAGRPQSLFLKRPVSWIVIECHEHFFALKFDDYIDAATFSTIRKADGSRN